MYCVGNLIFPRNDDPIFEDYAQAEEDAIYQSYTDSPIGIWEGEDDLIVIVYQQKIYPEG